MGKQKQLFVFVALRMLVGPLGTSEAWGSRTVELLDLAFHVVHLSMFSSDLTKKGEPVRWYKLTTPRTQKLRARGLRTEDQSTLDS